MPGEESRAWEMLLHSTHSRILKGAFGLSENGFDPFVRSLILSDSGFAALPFCP